MPLKLQPDTRERADALGLKLQECETEAHAIGFTLTAHKINAAKNQTGWDLADRIEASMAAGKAVLERQPKR